MQSFGGCKISVAVRRPWRGKRARARFLGGVNTKKSLQSVNKSVLFLAVKKLDLSYEISKSDSHLDVVVVDEVESEILVLIERVGLYL